MEGMGKNSLVLKNSVRISQTALYIAKVLYQIEHKL